jgi:hypothetical protein
MPHLQHRRVLALLHVFSNGRGDRGNGTDGLHCECVARIVAVRVLRALCVFLTLRKVTRTQKRTLKHAAHHGQSRRSFRRWVRHGRRENVPSSGCCAAALMSVRSQRRVAPSRASLQARTVDDSGEVSLAGDVYTGSNSGPMTFA